MRAQSLSPETRRRSAVGRILRASHRRKRRAASPEALEHLCQRLQKAGVAVRVGEPEPGLTGAIRFKSPCGHEFEVFSGYDYSQKAYTETGVRLRRIQHINLNASDLDSMSEFMTAVLGFLVSDYAYVGGEQALVFLRCDADHHVAGDRSWHGRFIPCGI